MTLKRIHREVADLKKEDLGPIVLAPSDDNLYLWKGSIPGPEGSVYEHVPAIANQYVRNRKAHDAMARQWAEMYAKPPPPPPVVPSAKAKGKQKAAVSGASSAPPAASTPSEPITIEDSDDEGQVLPKRCPTTGSKRKRAGGEKVEVNLVDDADEVEVSESATTSKKRAVGAGRTPTLADAAGSSRSQPTRQLREVIVLDDD
ncbi:hypothetical protein C0991_002161 [Blastosporella zonata]|nr:hypothetical protein C0991_002161 [Blastosporella zonata]